MSNAYIIVSFFISNEEAMRNLRKIWDQRSKTHDLVIQEYESIQVDHSEFGGQIWLLDPLRLEEGPIAKVNVPLAFGMAFSTSSNMLLCTSGSSISAIKEGAVQHLSIVCNLFNDLHTIQFNNMGNLIGVSTGIDSILEINPVSNELIWFWAAGEQGFSKTGQVEPLDLHEDYRLTRKSTPEHCTHINSALDLGDGTVLATLFHQGLLIKIRKNDKSHVVILSGLKQPHSVRSLADGFSVCNTQGSEIIVLDKNLRFKNSIQGNFSWVQDALPVNKSASGWVVCDSNNHRLVLVNCAGVELGELKWEADSRKQSSILLINKKDAQSIFGKLP